MDVQKASLATEAATTDITFETGNLGSVLCGFAVADAGVDGARG